MEIAMTRETTKMACQDPEDPIQEKAVTTTKNQTLVTYSKPVITVAEFTKIKDEPLCLNEDLSNLSGLVISATAMVAGTQVNISAPIEEQNCVIINKVSKNINIDLKRELLEPQCGESSLQSENTNTCEKKDIVHKNEVNRDEHEISFVSLELSPTIITNFEAQNSLETNCFDSTMIVDKQQIDGESQKTSVTSVINDSNSESSDEMYYAIKYESADGFRFNENFKYIKTDNSTALEIINPELTKKKKLVKNPLAFLRKGTKPKESVLIGNINQEDCLRTTTKSEHIISDKQLETAILSESFPTIENMHENLIKAEVEQSSISLNELNIKSENLDIAEDNHDIYETFISKLYVTNYNSNSSLDVNLSNEDTDFEDASSKQSTDNSKSIMEEPSKYSSILEQSSTDKVELSVKKPTLRTDIKTTKQPVNVRKPYKLRNVQRQVHGRKQSKTLFKTAKIKPKAPKKFSKKHTQKDYTYKLGISKKNLFKTNMKTRKKRPRKVTNATLTLAKEDFPKPFKFVHAQEVSRVATELPKPITLKCELTTSTMKNKKLYLRPEFQPCVRLKRIKSQELLVPLKTSHVRRTRKFKGLTKADKQMASDKRRDFIIQRVYSLNACSKWNRLNIEHNRSYFADHGMLNNNIPDESLTETESKYFSPQELFSHFHSSTPDNSSMFSGPIDSGVSTSTATVSHHNPDNNKTLLLEIAAERAFINNHLKHFGYSAVQFDLYNSPNDLEVLLKYLFGNMNTI